MGNLFMIREALPEDAENLVEFQRVLADEPHNGILMAKGEFTRTPEEQHALIEQWRTTDNALAIIAEANSEIVGFLFARGGNVRVNRGNAGIGITVRKDWRGRGVGKALMERVIEWGRENPVIHRLELEVFTHNTPALRLYEKVGFQHEATKRHPYFKEGEFIDSYLMSIVFENQGIAE